MATPALLARTPKGRVARPFFAVSGVPPQSKAWYAVRVRSNFEFQVALALYDRFAAFLPFYLRRHREHGRDLLRRRPLFPGYVFISADLNDRSVILSTRGVVGLIGGRRPEPIPAAVIENLKIAAANPEALMPATPAEGEFVTVARGPLAGLTGIMERVKGGRRLIVRVEFLNRACALEIGEAEVYRALSNARSAA